MTKAVTLRGGAVVAIIFALLLPQSVFRTSAQGGAIQLAVDTANFNQDGLLVLFGGLRLQGEIGLPVAAGDVNGDGRADVLFGGMYGSSDPFTNNGTVNLYLSDGRDSGFINQADHPPNVFGAANLPSVIDLASPPAGVRTARIVGAREEDHWGGALQVGDVNNDGISDIIIGASIDRDSGAYVTVQDQVSGHNFFAAGNGG